MLWIQCIVGCILFTSVILPIQYKDPIKMIMSYPPKIIERIEGLPQYKDTIKQHERSHMSKKVLGLLAFVFLFALIAYYSGCRSFTDTFVHVFTLFFVINMYDLIVLDLGIFCHSKRLRIPGSEDMDKEYKDPWFHVRGACIGIILGVIVAILSGGIVFLL